MSRWAFILSLALALSLVACGDDEVDDTGTDKPDSALTDSVVDVSVAKPDAIAPECKTKADCAAEEDGDACNGTLYCDKASGLCKVNPTTVVTCSATKDTTCQQNRCNAKSGACEMLAVAQDKPCDDGEPCTPETTCESGQCVGASVCKCQQDGDCISREDGDLCNGTLYCDTGEVPYGCKLNPATVVTCSSAKDTTCAKAACEPKVGKCEMTPVADGTACQADDFDCTKDACQSGACQVGAIAEACGCTSTAACQGLDDDLCDGLMFCNLAKKVCETMPGSAVSCPPLSQGPCMANACNVKTGQCEVQALADGSLCDDGTKCSDKSSCSAGQCVATANKCQCSASADCQAYEDGNLCNGTLYCHKSSGMCVVNPGTVIECQAATGDLCRNNQCDEKTGKCKLVAVKDGTPCEADGTQCTSVDTCVAGKCAQLGDNGCDCVKDADCAKFEDKNLCNGTLYCDLKQGKCLVNPATVVVCAKGGTACAPNTCQAKDGTCKPTPKADGLACDKDGLSCSVDTCQSGKCAPSANKCLCWVAGDCAPFEDGDACNGTMFCNKAGKQPVCQLNPATVVQCKAAAAGACLADVCDAKDGKCKPAPTNAGKSCDDGNVCTGGDVCAAGMCAGVALGAKTPCNDGNACTVGDGCGGGVCLAGAATKVCDDKNVCTQDSCDAKKGCVVVSAPAECNDGDACSLGDNCQGGVCLPSAGTLACDDKNPCTDDSCDKLKGCVHGNNSKGCSDGSVCTVNDACKSGKCVAGAVKKCDDSNPCTKDSCDANKGCLAVALKDGTICGAGKSCQTGKCVVMAECAPGWNVGSGSGGSVVVASGQKMALNKTFAVVTGSNPAGSSSLSVGDTTGFKPGDDALVITMFDHVSSMAASQAGSYELTRIKAVQSGKLVLNAPLAYSFSASATRGHQVVRVPEYESVTVKGTVNAKSYKDYLFTSSTTLPHLGGVIAFKVKGTLTVAAGGVIDASTLGYSGGFARMGSISHGEGPLGRPGSGPGGGTTSSCGQSNLGQGGGYGSAGQGSGSGGQTYGKPELGRLFMAGYSLVSFI